MPVDFPPADQLTLPMAGGLDPRKAPWRQKLARWVESRRFQTVIVVLIVFNAAILGLETSATAMQRYGSALHILDQLILAIFVAEICARFVAHGLRLLRDPWGIFDIVVVGIALLPSGGAFTVLRSLRVLRVLRLFSVVPSMRRVVSGLLSAIPGLTSIIAIMAIIVYVAAVMATRLFGEGYPEWFGTIGDSAFTLFQIMTLEGWADIAREVGLTHPWGWLFFVAYILLVTFTMLNLFIAVIVNAMQKEHEADLAAAEAVTATEQEDAARRLHADILAIQGELRALRRLIEKENGPAAAPPGAAAH